MKKTLPVRTDELDVEKCVELSGGNRFKMVLTAAQRAREISHKNRGSDKFEHTHPVITALLEIQKTK